MSLTDAAYTFMSCFLALFPVLNPIGNGFIVNDFLKGLDDAQRKAIVKKITVNCLLIGLYSLIVGKLVLLLFNLATPVIQLAGGILICKTGFEWLSDPKTSATSEGKQAIDTIHLGSVEEKVFYPISFPICFGPGSISVVFTLMAMTPAKDGLPRMAINYVIIALVIAVLCGILHLVFSQGNRLLNRLDHSSSLIINKLVAFLTFCIGLQIIITGLSDIFHLSVF